MVAETGYNKHVQRSAKWKTWLTQHSPHGGQPAVTPLYIINYKLYIIHYPHAYILHHPHHQPPAHRRRIHHSSHRPDRRQCANSRRHAGALRHGGEDTGGHQGRQEHKSAERQFLRGDRSQRLDSRERFLSSQMSRAELARAMPWREIVP